MPWTVEKGHGCPADKPWAVVQADGTRMGCHATEDDAKQQQAALYAQEGRTMTTDVPVNPLDGVPEALRPLLPDWAGDLRDRAVTLADIEIVSRAKGGDGRTVVAYAAVFDSPAEVRDQDGHYDEQIARPAFDRSIRERAGKINVFYNHGKNLYGGPSDRGSVPIGTPTELRTDARGLRTVTQYNRTPLADEVLEAIKAGSMRGMSFTGGFLRSDPPRGPYYERTDGGLVLVTRQEIALVEYGPTPIPAYDDAAVVSVRAGQLDDDEADQATRAAAVDRPWDGSAMVARLSNDAGAATYRRMFAAVREGGDPDAKGSYALPHHEVSTDGTVGAANLAAVRNALARLPQTQGLSASAKKSAESHLRAHMPADSDASKGPTQGRSDTSTTSSDAATEVPAAHRTEAIQQDQQDQQQAAPEQEPHTHSEVPGTTAEAQPASATTTTSRSHSVEPEQQQTMTAEERRVRREEIRTRMAEIDSEYNGATLPDNIREEWDRISTEMDEHKRAIIADTARKQRLKELADEQERTGSGERVNNERAGYGLGYAPAQIRKPEALYDLAELRNRARSIDDLPALYRDNAMRAIEVARFPGAKREAAQTRIQELLDGPDAEEGTLARRILVTGSPTYERAFGKYLARGSMTGLTVEEQRALSMGSATSAQLAVPFTLDPTIILTSDGATNPLRQISRVETITGRTWEGVTSAGITVARAGEAAAASDNAPALAQPTLTPTRVQGFVPFSIEADQDWGQLRAEMTRLLQDAKDVEEATSFVTGNGTPPNPSGIVSTLTTASNVNDGYASFDAADIYAVENALPPRFQPRARWLARKNTYNLVRAVDTYGGATLWVRLGAGLPGELIGYPAHEASAMYTRSTAGNRYLILGDFSNFLIVDKAGMDVELIPHLFDVTNNMPTGSRGLYAIWRNNAAILVPNAFRGLTYAT